MAACKQEIVVGVATRGELSEIVVRDIGLAFRGREILMRVVIASLLSIRHILKLIEFALRVVPLHQRRPVLRLHHIRRLIWMLSILLCHLTVFLGTIQPLLYFGNAVGAALSLRAFVLVETCLLDA